LELNLIFRSHRKGVLFPIFWSERSTAFVRHVDVSLAPRFLDMQCIFPRQLPNEVWMDIMDWLRGYRFLLTFSQIGDRQFNEIVQHWLHKWTKNVCIDLDIKSLFFPYYKPETPMRSQACLFNLTERMWGHGHWSPLGFPFAEGPMPENMDFRQINIEWV
jgi:hypothetical protein